MNINALRLFTIYTFFIFVCIGFSSCLSVKELKLFQNLPDSTKYANIKLPKFIPPVIMAGDVLSVTVVTNDPTASAGINSANQLSTGSTFGVSAAANGAAQGGDSGYLIDKDGNIEMPILGKIQLLGLNIDEAREKIRRVASEYLTDPIIVVKNLNIKITILGEVQKPGTFNIANDRITIVDLLAYSGDFTPYAKRDNVLLLRKNSDNTISSIRLDIKKSDILQSPYYYLQNNDVIYVEPNPGKAYSSDVIFTRNVSYITLAISFFTTLLLILKR